MTQFHERLKQARTDKGLSKEALAAKVGISARTIGRYEDGSRIPDDVMIGKLSLAMGVDFDWLEKGWKVIIKDCDETNPDAEHMRDAIRNEHCKSVDEANKAWEEAQMKPRLKLGAQPKISVTIQTPGNKPMISTKYEAFMLGAVTGFGLMALVTIVALLLR